MIDSVFERCGKMTAALTVDKILKQKKTKGPSPSKLCDLYEVLPSVDNYSQFNHQVSFLQWIGENFKEFCMSGWCERSTFSYKNSRIAPNNTITCFKTSHLDHHLVSL